MSDAQGAQTAEFALVLGSNHGRARHLRLAARRIGDAFEVLACTPAMRTRDGDGQRYLNAAIRVRSDLPLPALREAMQAIETDAGRERGARQVTLDIDVVASRAGGGAWQVHKPEDLQRDYVRALLARIGFV